MTIRGNRELGYLLEADFAGMLEDLSGRLSGFDGAKTFLVREGEIPVLVQCAPDCDLLEPTGRRVRIRKRHDTSLIAKLVINDDEFTFYLHYLGGELKIVGSYDFEPPIKSHDRFIGSAFFDNPPYGLYFEGMSTASQNNLIRRFYVPVVSLNYPALTDVLKTTIIPYVRNYSFLPEDGSVFVELDGSTVKITFYPNVKMFSPFWDEKFAQFPEEDITGIFYLYDDVPIRIRANKGNRYVTADNWVKTYSYNLTTDSVWSDDPQDCKVWRYGFVNNAFTFLPNRD